MPYEVTLNPFTGEWRIALDDCTELVSTDKTRLEAALDLLENCRVQRRRELPILGRVTDAGKILWNGGASP